MVTRYTNGVERAALIGAFSLFALIMARPLIAGGPTSGKVIPATLVCGFLLSAIRARNRPSVELEYGRVVVRGPLRTRLFQSTDVDRWDVEEARVGAFRRSVLVVHLEGGDSVNLGRDGIWASMGGSRELELREFAARLP